MTEMGIEYCEREDGFRNAYAFRKRDGVHLLIHPDPVENHDRTFSGWIVDLYGDDKGEVDFGKYLNGMYVGGKPDDLEEIADTFGRRLGLGVRPEDFFKDIEDATRISLQELAEKFGLRIK